MEVYGSFQELFDTKISSSWFIAMGRHWLYWVYIKRDFQKSPSEEWDSVNLVMCVRCSNFLTLKLFACGLSFLWMPLAYISITFRETQITSISKSKWITLVIYWILCNNLIICISELIFKCYSKIVLKFIVHSHYKTKNDN